MGTVDDLPRIGGLCQGLIALRKSDYLFRMHTHEEIDAHFTTLSENFNIVTFSLENEEKKYIVVFNANRNDTSFEFEKGKNMPSSLRIIKSFLIEKLILP